MKLASLALALSLASVADAAVTVTQKGARLKIQGDDQSDVVTVDGTNLLGRVVVRVNGANPLPFFGVRDVVIALGAGNDELELSALQVGGDVVANLGAGEDSAIVDDSGDVDGPLIVGRDLTIALGGQPGDVCAMTASGDGPLLIGRRLSIRGAAALQVAGLGGSAAFDPHDVVVGADLRIQSTEKSLNAAGVVQVVLADVDVGGKTRITLGANPNVVHFVHCRLTRGLDARLGSGDDVLDFGNVDTAIDATFKANGGAGNDVIQDVDALALVAFPTLENFEEISVFP
ncbi:MAG: hypothetical protein IT459_18495 [Planctomycetes bacterium]|nr:hypothetical protein [Planctomycetota bacterium]